ncbi:uncharacterized protein LOC124355716 [Homalodisca vitripennis]|uniref:uncharacterized protein LOC124355716 n=1 Tax=Homalodisca vitripennis TaxID=197043 RepID=UPI001EECC078|nr:uncharacterized protein LOC124355716 [Homalodisca vitripennis]
MSDCVVCDYLLPDGSTEGSTWFAVGDIQKIPTNATIDLLKKKIENLKCSFRRELRKVRASETTGAGSSQIYTPRLWFYELMSFLEEKEMIREGLDTLEEDESQMDAVVSN